MGRSAAPVAPVIGYAIVLALLAVNALLTTAALNRLRRILGHERKLMALSQELLDIATQQKSILDGIKTVVDGLATGGIISPEAAAAIRAAFSGNTDEMNAIDAALRANTTPPTP